WGFPPSSRISTLGSSAVLGAVNASSTRRCRVKNSMKSSPRSNVGGWTSISTTAAPRPCLIRRKKARVDPRVFFSAFQWRVIARENRVGDEFYRIHSPELADVVIGLDRPIHHPTVLLLGTPHVDVDHHVAVVVEADRSARRFRQRDRTDCLDKFIGVV